ncbi:hypothetical protein [Bradyrhizobium arachidis]|nr:hypothetical protein [Bradyrhizobium arachidis]
MMTAGAAIALATLSSLAAEVEFGEFAAVFVALIDNRLGPVVL